MKVKELAKHIHARLYLGAKPEDLEVVRFHASDTMSDLIAHAAPGTLLVTSLNNNQLVRVAELMDVPGICLVAGSEPGADLLLRAHATGTAILVSMYDMEGTCRSLTECLGGDRVMRT